MPREIDPPSVNREFLLAALAEGKRMDGRLALEMRAVGLEFGEEMGWCTCKMGKTAVLAQVTATIVKPRDDRPYEGFLLINSEISPMASAIYEVGRSSEDEVMITRLLEKSIRRTEAVDREALCIVAGEKVWQLRLTLHFLADDGNLLGCASVAAMTALRQFRRPEIEVLGDEVIIHSPDERAPIPLAIHHVPICVTFAYFEGLSPILDPTHLEDIISTGSLTLTLNAQRELCVLSKAGGTALGVRDIMDVMQVGVDRVRELTKLMEGALERDLEHSQLDLSKLAVYVPAISRCPKRALTSVTLSRVCLTKPRPRLLLRDDALVLIPARRSRNLDKFASAPQLPSQTLRRTSSRQRSRSSKPSHYLLRTLFPILASFIPIDSLDELPDCKLLVRDQTRTCTQRKRTTSSADLENVRPATLKKSSSSLGLNGVAGGKNKVVKTRGGLEGTQLDWRDKGKGSMGGRGDAPPSLNMEFRNSLMLPGLSEQFSVLLPSLSTLPETSVRSLLALQRARPHGPSITREEENLLLAEMKETKSGRYANQEWDGQPPKSDQGGWPSTDSGVTEKHTGSVDLPSPANSRLTASASSPSVLARSSPPSSTWGGADAPFFAASPTSTSSSFASFKTFGVTGEPSTGGVKVKSYGFGGSGGMRDAEYIRRVKKSASGRNLNGSISSKKSNKSDGDPRYGTPPIASLPLPPIGNGEGRSDSSSGSERTATPTSPMTTSISPLQLRRPGWPKVPPHTSLLGPYMFQPLSPPDPAYNTIANGADKSRKRQTLLAGLSSAQVKRMSLALQQIEEELYLIHSETQSKRHFATGQDGAGEEIVPISALEKKYGERSTALVNGGAPNSMPNTLPISDQPTAAEPPGNQRPDSNEVPLSSKLPPSPRSLNLMAHVEPNSRSSTSQISLKRGQDGDNRGPIPQPILTPSRTQPAQHVPTPSTGSSWSAMSPPIAAYVPGQPRPVGSMHRSDGSMSSRSGTPNAAPLSPASPALSSPTLQPTTVYSPLTYHPPVIHARKSSLGRSPSVNGGSPDSGSSQSMTSPETDRSRVIGPTGSRLAESASLTRTSPSLAMYTLTPAKTIAEDDETEEEYIQDEDHGSPPEIYRGIEIRSVVQRHTVADSRRESEIPALPDSVNHSALSRSVSAEGTVDDSREGIEDGAVDEVVHQSSPLYSLQKRASASTLNSCFAGASSEFEWDDLLSDQTLEQDVELRSFYEQQSQVAVDLRRLTGLGKGEMLVLQSKLLEKAKSEREAFRNEYGESPMLPQSPSLMLPVLPSKSAIIGPRILSPQRFPLASPPPTSWRTVKTQSPPVASKSTQVTIMSRKEVVTPHQTVDIFVPPPGFVAPPVALENQMGTTRMETTSPSMLPIEDSATSSGHTTSDRNEEEIIFTPLSAHLSRKSSSAKNGASPADEDQEKRRDFEERIAKATAALNRTPSISQTRLQERKGTKRGPMIISSPTLVSSSAANFPITSITPPMGTKSNVTRSLEKPSGSGSKMSLKWKKLAAFRKSPSMSADEMQRLTRVTAPSVPMTAMQRLDDPIALHPSNPQLSNTAQNALNAFRFPASPEIQCDKPIAANGLANSHSLIGNLTTSSPATSASLGSVATFKRSQSDNRADSTAKVSLPAKLEIPQFPHNTNSKTVDRIVQLFLHTPSGTDDSARVKFIAAGRAVGLNDGQLNELLAQKDMLDRAGTTTSTRSFQSTVTAIDPESQLSPTPDSVEVTRTSSAEKGVMGLFRSLSRGKNTAQVPPLVSTTGDSQDDTSHKVVVRRTLLVPHEAIPPLPTSSAHSPNNAVGGSLDQGPLPQRKPSVKRKPLNLTLEDQNLVRGSPSPRLRKSGGATAASHSTDPGNPGLGFLHPNVGLGHSTSTTSSSGRRVSDDDRSMKQSSAGGSLYDLYSGEDRPQNEHQELCPPPGIDCGRPADQAVRANQAVEIREYADGKVVWSIIDALRESSVQDAGGECRRSFATSHSRETSQASASIDGSPNLDDHPGVFIGWHSNLGRSTPALNFDLRHRDRGVPDQPRPPTRIYYTSSRDVAALIDQLSHDLDASHGRIDIRPSSSHQLEISSSASSPFPYQTSHPDTMDSSTNPAFEDAPSPRKGPERIFVPPASATVPAGGFSPKRQLFIKQGFAAHRHGMSGSGSVGSAASPGAPSFASSGSSLPGRSVEERLQALLDRLKEDGQMGADSRQ